MKRLFTVFAILPAVPVFDSIAQTPGTGGLRNIATLREGVKRQRISSFDKTGGNRDYLAGIEPKAKATLAEISGPGTITHIWVTIAAPERYHLRRIVLRAWWDGETEPSIEAPIGDFFGLGYGEPNYWSSAPLAVSDRALNCFFPMPFGRTARIEIENQGDQRINNFYYYVDYETYAAGSQGARDIERQGRFHAWWNRELTKASDSKINLDGKNNYLIMDATGHGHYVGV